MTSNLGSDLIQNLADGPYEQMKALTRGKGVTPESLHDFIQGLDIPDDAKARLLALTPTSYTGNAAEQASQIDAG